jgi:uncharacterized protein YecE (DUF72 family)
VKGGRKAYYQRFKTVEVQETFYRVPRIETLKKMRQEAPPDFIFNMKAWQAITHPASSPTWRSSNLPPGNPANYGHLKPTRENLKAWETVLDMAEVLRPRVVVIQTPPSFRATSKNMEYVEKFFRLISRDDFRLGWEPRGEWAEETEKVRRICEKYGLIHVVDLLKRGPAVSTTTLYARLHGLGRGEVNYSYHYSLEDLERLRNILTSEKDWEEAYIMFNNISMAEDASKG